MSRWTQLSFLSYCVYEGWTSAPPAFHLPEGRAIGLPEVSSFQKEGLIGAHRGKMVCHQNMYIMMGYRLHLVDIRLEREAAQGGSSKHLARGFDRWERLKSVNIFT